MTHQETTAQFFDTQVECFGGFYEGKPCFVDRLALFVQSVSQAVPAGAKILDFGCGPGVIASALAERGYKVTGLDGSSGMIEGARGRAKAKGLKNVEFEQLDSTKLNLPSEAFDAVVCSSVIEYVPDDLALVGKLVAALKPGGVLAISVPQTSSILALAENVLRASGLHRKREGSKHLAVTLHRYQQETFLKQLTGLGLGGFQCTNFEFPFLGNFGIKLSRSRFLGAMLLVLARKKRS